MKLKDACSLEGKLWHLKKWKWKKQWKKKSESSVVSNSLRPHGLYSAWNSPGQNTGVGSLSLLQRIFPAQGLNPGLPHCRQIIYQLSHKGSPRILEWVAYPFFSRSFQPRNQTGVSCIAGIFFTNWAIWEAYSECGERQMSFFGSDQHSCRSREFTYTLSLSPWEESWADSLSSDLSCHWAVPSWGKGLTQVKWNYSFHPLQCVKSWIFCFCFCLFVSAFAPAVCWNFSAGIPGFCNALLVHWWLSTLVFFEGKVVENLYFAMLMISLSSFNLHNNTVK